MRVKDKVAVVTGRANGIGLALCTRSDVGREEDVENLVSAAIDRFGRVDWFVSNAGIAVHGGIDTPTDGWQRSSASTSCPRSTRRNTAPHMLEQGSGHLLNVASAGGRLVIRVPGGTTSGLTGATEALTRESGP